MQQRLENFIDQHQLIDISDQLAIAVSGGKDSVAAAHLFNSLKKPFVIIHCNFKLRAEQSDGDERFVIELANELEHCKQVLHRSFETEQFCAQHKLSVQEGARRLRYEYFQSLYEQKVFSKLITAHHQSDDLETFFINLYRGSGITGLAGIPVMREYIIRPLMAFNSIEINQYIDSNNIKYREDESNSSTKYLRNKIRHDILPKINQTLPDFNTRAQGSLNHLKSGSEILGYLVGLQADSLLKIDANSGSISLDLSALDNYPHKAVFLFYLLDSYGFSHNQCEQMVLSDKTGATFYSENYIAVVDRSVLRIGEITEKDVEIEISGLGEYKSNSYQLNLVLVDEYSASSSSYVEIVDADLLQFPLLLRTWKQGDFFQPLGMIGTKLLSDFLIDEKIDMISKSKIKVLANGNEVFWIIGHRISDKWKITDSSDKFCRLSIVQS